MGSHTHERKFYSSMYAVVSFLSVVTFVCAKEVQMIGKNYVFLNIGVPYSDLASSDGITDTLYKPRVGGYYTNTIPKTYAQLVLPGDMLAITGGIPRDCYENDYTGFAADVIEDACLGACNEPYLWNGKGGNPTTAYSYRDVCTIEGTNSAGIASNECDLRTPSTGPFANINPCTSQLFEVDGKTIHATSDMEESVPGCNICTFVANTGDPNNVQECRNICEGVALTRIGTEVLDASAKAFLTKMRSKPCSKFYAKGDQSAACTLYWSPQDRNLKPAKHLATYNPGIYYIEFGTAQDTCKWHGNTCRDQKGDLAPCCNATIPGARCPSTTGGSVQGPCVRILEIRDVDPPVLTVNKFKCEAYIDGINFGPLTEYVNETSKGVAKFLEAGSKCVDDGVSAYDIGDGTMTYTTTLCPLNDTAEYGCTKDTCTCKVGTDDVTRCGINKKVCRQKAYNTTRTGQQILVYIAVDRVGNLAFATRWVSVRDTLTPTLALKCENGQLCDDTSIFIDESTIKRYDDPGQAAFDNSFGVLHEHVALDDRKEWRSAREKVSGYAFPETIDVHNPVVEFLGDMADKDIRKAEGLKLMKYSIRYDVMDELLNYNSTLEGNYDVQTRTVTFEDITDPLIAILGPNETTLRTGLDSYTELFATAEDNNDGSLTYKITRDIWFEDTGYAEGQARCYYAPSKDCNTAVAECPNKQNPCFFTLNENFNDYWKPEMKTMYEDVSRGFINPQAIHSTRYKVRYTVKDHAGNEASALRDVLIEDTIKPTVTFIDGPTSLTEIDGEIIRAWPQERGEQYFPTFAELVNVTDNADSDLYFKTFQRIQAVAIESEVQSPTFTGSKFPMKSFPAYLDVPIYTKVKVNITALDLAKLKSDPITVMVIVKDSRRPRVCFNTSTCEAPSKRAPAIGVDDVDSSSTIEGAQAFGVKVMATDTGDGGYFFKPRFFSRIRERVRVVKEIEVEEVEEEEETVVIETGVERVCTNLLPELVGEGAITQWNTDEDTVSLPFTVLSLVDNGATFSYSGTSIGGPAIAITSVKNNNGGVWGWRCCRTIGGCGNNVNFNTISAAVGKTALLLSSNCEIAFTPKRDFFSILEDRSSRPSITVQAWARQDNDTTLLSKVVNAAGDVPFKTELVGCAEVEVYMSVNSFVDPPQVSGNPVFDAATGLASLASLIPFEEGGTLIPLFKGSALYNPDNVEVTDIIITVDKEDFFRFEPLPIGITHQTSGDGRHKFIGDGNQLFERLLQNVRFAPSEAKVEAQTKSNVEITVHSPGESKVSTFGVFIVEVNRRPQLTIADADRGDDAPLAGLSITDDDNYIAEAHLYVLKSIPDGVQAFAFDYTANTSIVVATKISNTVYTITGNGTDTQWQTFLQATRYTGGVYPNSVLLSVFDGASESLPLLAHVNDITSATPPRVNLAKLGGGTQINSGGQVVQEYRADGSTTPLFNEVDVTVTKLPSSAQYLTLTIELVMASDCPHEVLSVVGAPFGFTVTHTSAASIRFDATSPSSTTISQIIAVLNAVSYTNTAPLPTAGARIVKVLLHTDVGESPAALMVLDIEVPSNFAPSCYPEAGVDTLYVPQDIPDVKNDGISIEELVSHPTVETVARVTETSFVVSCEGGEGCTWAEASERCDTLGASLCSRDQVEEYFTQPKEMQLAWTSDMSLKGPGRSPPIRQRDSSRAFPTRVSILDADNNPVFVDLPDRDNVTLEVGVGGDEPQETSGSTTGSKYAYVYYGFEGAKAPTFFPGLSTDNKIGPAVDAVCCTQVQKRLSRGKRVQVEVITSIDVAGPTRCDVNITGQIIFEQLHANDAVTVKSRLHLIQDTEQCRSEGVNFTGITIHKYPLKHTNGWSCNDGGGTFIPSSGVSFQGGFRALFGQGVTSFVTKELTLFGEDSIVGRSLSVDVTGLRIQLVRGDYVAVPYGTAVACGNIIEAVPQKKLLAQGVYGTITFTQAAQDPTSDTTIMFEFVGQASKWNGLIAEYGSAPAPVDDNTTCALNAWQEKPSWKKLVFPDGFSEAIQIYTVQGWPLSGASSLENTQIQLRRTFRYPDDVALCDTVVPLAVLQTTAMMRMGTRMGYAHFVDNTRPTFRLFDSTDLPGLITTNVKSFPSINFASTTRLSVYKLPVVVGTNGDPCANLGAAHIVDITSSSQTKLFGANGVVGRSLVIMKDGVRSCVTIPHPTTPTTVVAEFRGPTIFGKVTFQQSSFGVASTTTMLSELVSTDTTTQGTFTFAGDGRCGCGATCASGGGGGGDKGVDDWTVTLAIGSTSVTRAFVTGLNMQLTGAGSVVGKTLQVFTNSLALSTDAPLAYATLVTVEPREAVTVFKANGSLTSGQVHMRQTPGHATSIDINLFNGGAVQDWFITELPLKTAVGVDGKPEYACKTLSYAKDGFDPYTACNNPQACNNLPEPGWESSATTPSAGNLGATLGDLRDRRNIVDRGNALTPLSTKQMLQTALSRQYQTNLFGLHGGWSVMGRGLVVTSNSETWCAPIEPPRASITTFVADFNPQASIGVGGRITISQSDAAHAVGETVINVNLVSETPTLKLKFNGWAAVDFGNTNTPVDWQLGVASPNRLAGDASFTVDVAYVHTSVADATTTTVRVYQAATGKQVVARTSVSKDDEISIQLEAESSHRLTYLVVEIGCVDVNGTTRTHHVLLDTSCNPNSGMVVGTKFGVLEVTKSPCFDWHLAVANGNACSTTPYNPHSLARAGCAEDKLKCPSGELTLKHGQIRVPGLAVFSEASFLTARHESIAALQVVISGSGGSAQCARFVEVPTTAIVDPNGLSEMGVAIVGVDNPHGKFQTRMRDDNDAVWLDVDPAFTTPTNALLLDKLSSIRFKPNKGFQGASTCACLEEVHTTEGCIPCRLNRKAATFEFVAWDGSDSSRSGAKTSIVGKDAFSTQTKEITIEMTPATIDEMAPSGTIYAINYDVRDDAGNAALSYEHTITVIDTTEPLIVLRDEGVMSAEGGQPFVDPGVVAFDTLELDVSTSVTINLEEFKSGGYTGVTRIDTCPSSVSSNGCQVGGKYRVTYTASDTSGGTATTSRILNVVDSSPPIIFPTTGNTFQITRVEAGYGSESTYTERNTTSDCLFSRDYYHWSELGQLGCYTAVDDIEGTVDEEEIELTLWIISSRKFTEAWSASNESYGPIRVGENPDRVGQECMFRDRADGVVDMECSLSPSQKAGPVKGQANVDALLKQFFSASAGVDTRYLLQLHTQDSSGNEAFSYRLVLIVDTTLPTVVFDTPTLDLEYLTPITESVLINDVKYTDYGDGARAVKPDQGQTVYYNPSTCAFANENSTVKTCTAVGNKQLDSLINTAVAGDYSIAYNATDRQQNNARFPRNVHVGTCTEKCGSAMTPLKASGLTVVSQTFKFTAYVPKWKTQESIRNLTNQIGAAYGNTAIGVPTDPTLPVFVSYDQVPAVLKPCLCDQVRITQTSAVTSGSLVLNVEIYTPCNSFRNQDGDFAYWTFHTLRTNLSSLSLYKGGEPFFGESNGAIPTVKNLTNCTLRDYETIYQESTINADAVELNVDEQDNSVALSVIIPIIVVVLLIVGVVVYYRLVWYKRRHQRVVELTMLASDDIYAEGFAVPLDSRPVRQKMKEIVNNPSGKKPPPRAVLPEDGPALPQKGGKGAKKAAILPEDGPPVPQKGGEKKARPVTKFENTEDDFYDTGGAKGKAGFNTSHQEEKKKATVEMFENTEDDFYDTGNATKKGFNTSHKEEEKAPAPPPKPAVVFENTEDDFYDTGNAVKKAGFNTSHQEEEKAPPPPPKPAVVFENTEEDFYDTGNAVNKSGFNTSHQEEEKAPPPPPKPAVVFENTEEDFYDTGNAVNKSGFNTSHQEEEKAPPPPPKPAVVFENTEEDFYDTGNAVTKAGFNTSMEDDEAPPPPRPKKATPVESTNGFNTNDEPLESPADPMLHPYLKIMSDGPDGVALEFLHGAISREEAEDCLTFSGLADGSFLLRMRDNHFVLTLCARGHFEHHVLEKADNKFQLNGQPLSQPCATLGEVVVLLSTSDDEQVATRLMEGIATKT